MVQTGHSGHGGSHRYERIFLIGMPGAGKTTIAHLLAHRLGWTCIDTDACVECMQCARIEEIFSRHGEAEFRKQEADCLRRSAHMREAVIATGGGAPLHDDGMQFILGSGLVIFLETSPDTLQDRLRQSGVQRPLLADSVESLMVRLEALLRGREETYRHAHYVFTTDGRTPEEIVEGLVRVFGDAVQPGAAK